MTHPYWITFSLTNSADIVFWNYSLKKHQNLEFTDSHAHAFGERTVEQLSNLSVAVIGCSGTGSPVIEQLVRLGIGQIVLVDDDVIEVRNVNRILNSTIDDAHLHRFKVDVLADSIRKLGLGTRVYEYRENLWNRKVIMAVAECDLVFGCMDSVGGRYLLNSIATHYLIPYFDLGVRLDSVLTNNEQRTVREVCGTVHYLQPGKSSLMSRGLVKMEQVRAEGLRRHDPGSYKEQVDAGYIKGIQESRPAVISINVLIASIAVNDLLARLHPYRDEDYGNSHIASITTSLSSVEMLPDSETKYPQCHILRENAGRGDIEPLLGLVEFAEPL